MDKGHEELLRDLKIVLVMAERFEFHDFKNERFATPKVELVKILDLMIGNVKVGKYDNKPNQ
jgi:hypothetical protein